MVLDIDGPVRPQPGPRLQELHRWAAALAVEADDPTLHDDLAERDAQPVIDCLDRVGELAVMLQSVTDPQELRVRALQMQRALEQLALAVSRTSDAHDLLARMQVMLLGDSQPREWYRRARAAWAAEHDFGEESTNRLLRAPSSAWGALQHIACDDDWVCSTDEALALRYHLDHMIQLLEDARPTIDDMLVERLRRRAHAYAERNRTMLDIALSDVLSEEQVGRGVASHVLLHRTRMRQTLATVALTHLCLGSSPAHQRTLRRAQHAGQAVSAALRDVLGADTAQVTAAVLTTKSRDEFSVLFDADVDADTVRGVYLAGMDTIALSPGHSRVLLDPGEARPVQPVIVHEMAHALCNNHLAASLSEAETALSEGFAESLSSMSDDHAAAALAERLGREVRFARTEFPYQRQQALLDEVLQAAGWQDSQTDATMASRRMLQQLAASNNMTAVLAARFGCPADEIEQAVTAYVQDGRPGQLRSILSMRDPQSADGQPSDS